VRAASKQREAEEQCRQAGGHRSDDIGRGKRNAFALAAAYVVGSVTASLAALFVGLALFRGGAHLP